MIPRVLEPEAMDTPEEARDYDAMDHAEVNARFVADFLAAHGACQGGEILDVGTGPARIPIALCQADSQARVLGIDLARHMIEQARQNIEQAGLSSRIWLDVADAKRLDYPDNQFEAVISNTIVHHIPKPARVLAEIVRTVRPGGTLFVRDLARPGSQMDLDRLVATYAGHESPPARALYRASLHAALTLDEVRRLVKPMGIRAEGVGMTSDRHWTIAWRKSG